jgi:hypothetical protein
MEMLQNAIHGNAILTHRQQRFSLPTADAITAYWNRAPLMNYVH